MLFGMDISDENFWLFQNHLIIHTPAELVWFGLVSLFNSISTFVGVVFLFRGSQL